MSISTKLLTQKLKEQRLECVLRPILMISLNYSTFDKSYFTFLLNSSWNYFKAWNKKFIDFNHGCDVDNSLEESFEDWPMLTWSLGWTSFLTKFSTQNLSGSVGNNFIGIHVWLLFLIQLPNNQRNWSFHFALNASFAAYMMAFAIFLIKSKLFINSSCTFL